MGKPFRNRCFTWNILLRSPFTGDYLDTLHASLPRAPGLHVTIMFQGEVYDPPITCTHKLQADGPPRALSLLPHLPRQSFQVFPPPLAISLGINHDHLLLSQLLSHNP